MSHGFLETESQGQGNSNPVHLTHMTDQTKTIKVEKHNIFLLKITNLCNWDKQYCLGSPWHIFLHTTDVSLMILDICSWINDAFLSFTITHWVSNSKDKWVDP